MLLAGWYLEFRILCPPLFEREIPIGFTIMVSFGTESGPIVNHVLKDCPESCPLRQATALSLTGRRHRDAPDGEALQKSRITGHPGKISRKFVLTLFP